MVLPAAAIAIARAGANKTRRRMEEYSLSYEGVRQFSPPPPVSLRVRGADSLNEWQAMDDAQPEPTLECTMRADAEEAARRTLRYKFGRLSNRKIVERIRTGAAGGDAGLSDDELLERWFAVYEDALHRLRIA